MDQNNEQTIEIDILKLVEVVLQKWWIVLLSGLLAAALFLGFTIAFISPQYDSSVLFYVNCSSASFGAQSIKISGADISTAKNLVDTYCVILNTRLTLEDVSKKLADSGLEYTYDELTEMLTYGAVNQTEIFKVTVTCPNPADACTIANTIAQVLPEKISDVVDGSSVRVVDYAVVADARTSPSYSGNTLIGFAAGLVIAVLVLIVLYLLNDTITSEEWLLSMYKDRFPLLATIPDANTSGSSYGRYKKYGKYKYRYGYKGYGYKRYGYGYGGGHYGNYRYGYRNGYYGVKSSQLPKASEPTERIESV